MKTVFITGASSGIGKETAKYFIAKGWNVIATMRNPSAENELNKLNNVELLPCDVTDTQSIKLAIADGIKKFGKIDVLVNNAGYYTLGPLEATTTEQIKRQLDTNLLGLIETTKEILPHFRSNKSGVIVNIASIAGVATFPLQSLYNATKYAVEGFSESLQFELEQFNIRVKIIEPGIIKTDFYGRSKTVTDYENLSEYKKYAQRVVSNLIKNGSNGSSPVKVAETVFKAASDNRKKMRYRTGAFKSALTIRRLLPFGIYKTLVKSIVE